MEYLWLPDNPSLELRYKAARHARGHNKWSLETDSIGRSLLHTYIVTLLVYLALTNLIMLPL